MGVYSPGRLDTVMPELLELKGCIGEFLGDSGYLFTELRVFVFDFSDDLDGWFHAFGNFALGCKNKRVEDCFRVLHADVSQDLLDDFGKR